jgi:hypothetical protein
VTGVRNGGDLVVETLEALGAKTVFGIPGQHALGLFDAMGRGNLKFVSSRVENNSVPSPRTATRGPRGRWACCSCPPGRGR